MINTIILGHALNVLPKLPAESVSCVTTSPPYWGLRDYGIEPVIWDGDKDCKHIWKKEITKRPNASGGKTDWAKEKLAIKGVENYQEFVDYHKRETESNFCQLCGAWKGSLGLEPTFELYIKHLCDIFDEVKRVLRKDGTCWVNIGDSYNGNKIGNTNASTGAIGKPRYSGDFTKTFKKENQNNIPTKSLCDIPYRFSIEMINRGWIKRNTIIWWKLNCMPSSADDRFTIDFEYLFFFTKNNKAIFWTNEKTLECVDKNPLGIKGIEGKDWEWRKCPNCNGTGEKKIVTKDFIGYKLVKCDRCKGLKKVKYSFWSGHDYWFEQQFEKFLSNDYDRNRMAKARTEYGGKWAQDSGGAIKTQRAFVDGYAQGRNKRCVWIIPTQPFPLAHFAVYPEGLIEIPIKAGCPEFICKKCGKARVKILETEQEINEWNEEYFYKLLLGNSHSNRHYKIALEIMKKWMVENNCYNYETFYNWYLTQKQGTWKSGNLKTGQANKLSGMLPFPRPEKRLNIKTKAYTDCGCNAGFESGIVLDPFMGAGTTALVALKQRKRFIGIEIKQEYIDMSYKRIAKVQQNIF